MFCARFPESELASSYSSVISGGNGFGEANVVDLDTYILEEDRFEGYGYMSDSDLDTDDEGNDDLRRSVRPCPP